MNIHEVIFPSLPVVWLGSIFKIRFEIRGVGLHKNNKMDITTLYSLDKRRIKLTIQKTISLKKFLTVHNFIEKTCFSLLL